VEGRSQDYTDCTLLLSPWVNEQPVASWVEGKVATLFPHKNEQTA
jgi:hypothetical protein